jgi:hypothetical protein
VDISFVQRIPLLLVGFGEKNRYLIPSQFNRTKVNGSDRTCNLDLLRQRLPCTGMYMRNWTPTGRRPRHQATAAEAITIELRRAAGQLPECVAAELLDLSRQGARLRAPAALGEDEDLTFSLRSAQPALDLHLTGVVRWRKQEAVGRWLYGCEFKDELPLETLGELFLSGILSARPPASSGQT